MTELPTPARTAKIAVEAGPAASTLTVEISWAAEWE